MKWPVVQNLRLLLKARFARRFVGQLSISWTRDSRSEILTKPCLSDMLLLNLSLWKEITFCIHCSPVAGLSGWIYIRFGISGSAFPATIHRLMSRDKPLRTHWSIFIVHFLHLCMPVYKIPLSTWYITYFLLLQKHSVIYQFKMLFDEHISGKNMFWSTVCCKETRLFCIFLYKLTIFNKL